MAILKEMNVRPVPDRLEQAIYIAGTEAPKEEYARFEKIAIDASRKLVEALKKGTDVPVGRVLVAQDPLERLAYAMVGPLESGVELGELSARDFLRQPETEPQYSVAEGLGALVARWGAKVPVKLGTRVVRIDSTGPQVLIVTTSGQLDGQGRHRDGADRRAGDRACSASPPAQRGPARGRSPSCRWRSTTRSRCRSAAR